MLPFEWVYPPFRVKGKVSGQTHPALDIHSAEIHPFDQICPDAVAPFFPFCRMEGEGQNTEDEKKFQSFHPFFFANELYPKNNLRHKKQLLSGVVRKTEL